MTEGQLEPNQQPSLEPRPTKEQKATEPTVPKSSDSESPVIIPDRVYFRIGDVAEITGIKPYVLRFWEKEFEQLRPIKNNSGQRVYRKSDVEMVLLIKRLLYKQRYSIEGAKRHIRELRKNRQLATAKRERGPLNEQKLDSLRKIRRGLCELIASCSP